MPTLRDCVYGQAVADALGVPYGYRQDSCALSDSPIGPPSGAATRPAASRPGSASICHVLEPGGHEHESAPPVWEGTDHARAPADLSVQALDCVVGAYASPVLAREPRVGQGLGAALAHDLGRLPELGLLELGRDLERLGLGGLARLHGVDRLEHRGDTLGLFDFGTLASTFL